MQSAVLCFCCKPCCVYLGRDDERPCRASKRCEMASGLCLPLSLSLLKHSAVFWAQALGEKHWPAVAYLDNCQSPVMQSLR